MAQSLLEEDNSGCGNDWGRDQKDNKQEGIEADTEQADEEDPPAPMVVVNRLRDGFLTLCGM